MKLYRIKKSKIDNRDVVYMQQDVKAGTKIINYIGKVITNKKVDSPINLIIKNQYTYLH